MSTEALQQASPGADVAGSAHETAFMLNPSLPSAEWLKPCLLEVERLKRPMPWRGLGMYRCQKGSRSRSRSSARGSFSSKAG